jgi:tRNA(adenine34) deaminase
LGAHNTLEIQNSFISNFLSQTIYNNQELPSYSEIYSSDGFRIAHSSNLVESQNNPLLHSERIVIDQAIKFKQTRYLDNCVLLTTLEPCTLCMGSILKSRIAKVIYFLPNDNGDGISYLPIEWIYQLNHFPVLELVENKEIFSQWKTFFMDKR